MARQRIKGTQRQWVKEALLSGKAITHLDLIKACGGQGGWRTGAYICLLYTSPSPRDRTRSRMPSSA